MLLIIDNYDSFVYNIIHVIGLPEDEFTVRRNDQITADEIEKAGFDSVIISPGPMTPDQAGVSNEVIRRFCGKLPILGICLGHECIGKVFGSRVEQCPEIIHGEADEIILSGSRLYKDLPGKIMGARYHSLRLNEDTLDKNAFLVNARLKDGTIMGIEHKTAPLFGVQFHPESILTGENGKKILDNFMEISREFRRGTEDEKYGA